MLREIRISADHREKSSGIPDLLLKRGVKIEWRELKTGDYFINRKIMVERKTNEDFIQSLVRNRLFAQCQQMKKNNAYPLLIMEGNPYATNHRISRQAIKGAILSVSVAWQIPVFFTSGKEETADVLIMAGRQMELAKVPVLRSGYKPKKPGNRKLYFIQGLPAVGPVLASRLIDRFATVERIMNVTLDELISIEGIGIGRAKQIIDFIRN